MDLSIIIPAYNEETRIGLTLERTVGFLSSRSWDYELLIVDDGSRDRTGEVVERWSRENPAILCLRNQANGGKGYSIRRGVERSRGEFVGFMDADYKTDIATLDSVMVEFENQADGVIGDRTLSSSQILVQRRRFRQWGSEVFRRLLHRSIGLRHFTDTQCGFKFFRAEVMRELFRRQRVDGYMFDVEILVIAAEMGYDIRKVAVHWEDDPDSRFSPVSGTIRNIRELMQIKFARKK